MNFDADFAIDDSIRGVPPATAPVRLADVGRQGWRPTGGAMALPVLTIDEAALSGNIATMLGYVRERGIAIAPHAKTPMAPALAARLVEAGAWGTTVADIRQASVLLKAGLNRLMLANEVGGTGGAKRLAALAAAHPDADLYLFVDSSAAVEALAAAWTAPGLPPLKLLVEVGAGRAGARTLADAETVIDAVVAASAKAPLRLAGVAAYEGATASADPERSRVAILALLDLAAAAHRAVRARVGADAPLILTAGGSGFFDLVVATLGPIAAAEPATTLLLRSGAIFFHDHGTYDRALAALDARNGFALDGKPVSAREAFRPALRLWAEVLSRPEPGLVICGMGMRDVSHDQDLPIPLRLHRNDALVGNGMAGATVTKLNDQHAFVTVDPASDIAIGDVVEFGISHPCTCIDRWRILFGLDEAGTVSGAYRTFFG